MNGYVEFRHGAPVVIGTYFGRAGEDGRMAQGIRRRTAIRSFEIPSGTSTRVRSTDLETLEDTMKLVRSALLGSAASLCAVAGAQAADLPAQKAAPVEYVRICTAYGAGFFFIPGTDTCLRVGGRARGEFNFANARSRGVYSPTTFAPVTSSNADQTGFRGLGRLNLDARTQTAYGTLRAFVRIEIARRTGQFHSGTAIRQGNAEPAIGVDFFGQAQHQIVLDKAFIQFAGVTAGRATSFFDFYANDLGWFGIGGGSDRASTNLLAYTASFGSGWSATLSLEDPVERRFPVVTNLGGAALVSGATLFSGAE